MDIQTTATSLLEWRGDGLAIGFWEDNVSIIGDLLTLNTQWHGLIQEIIDEAEFKGAAASIISTRVVGNIKKLILVGLGKNTNPTSDQYRRAAAAIARAAKKEKCETLAISLPESAIAVGASKAISAPLVAQAISEGLLLALHEDKRFKSEKPDKSEEPATPPKKLNSVQLLGLTGQEAAVAQAQAVAAGVILARELVTAPANYVTPASMADTAQTIAKKYGMELKVLEQADCEKLGMGAFLGVSQASDLPPKFIHLIYKPKGPARKKLAIVGKGVTFDSGGLNIKGAGIETMKMDMGGAAATFGAAAVIGQLKPDVEVHFISAVAENMISGKAIHPGDILTASNGKTIEINNTDAEGRLTLADALVYAEKLGVDAIVDLATLTGACIVALGDDISGLWSPQQELADGILAAAAAAGEKFWQMPLDDKYFEGIKSPIADLKNTGPRGGGSITAALFLKQFIKDVPWAHLDVAGPVWSDKENGVNNAGATGHPVRTLVNWVLS
jgi:leucyl aminopeptidase